MSKGRQKVWRIYRFRERFELADDVRYCRQSSLNFTRDYVLPSGNEAVGYRQQLDMLRNGQDGERYCLLFGLYRQLVNETAKRSRAYRGYLLNAANEPLNDPQVAKLLKIHPKRMTRLLRQLEAVQLLERVEMPKKWDLSADNIPTRKERSRKRSGAQAKKKRDSKAKKQGFSGSARETTENCGRARAVPRAFEKEKGNGNKKREIENKRQDQALQTSHALEGKCKNNTQATTTPTTTPQLCRRHPTRGVCEYISFEAPQGRLSIISQNN